MYLLEEMVTDCIKELGMAPAGRIGKILEAIWIQNRLQYHGDQTEPMYLQEVKTEA